MVWLSMASSIKLINSILNAKVIVRKRDLAVE